MTTIASSIVEPDAQASPAGPSAVDLVVTWVDGSWPGYAAELARHATSPVDRNPNRTRDNLDLLRYALRSVARNLPWIDRVHVVTARPQVPRWLDPARARVVHHDALFAPDELPTFSSFAIVSRLHRVPDVSPRFVYLEDDRLFLAPTASTDLVGADGSLLLYAHGEPTPPGAARHAIRSPWERALAETNHWLDRRYGPAERPSLKRAPLFVAREALARLEQVFPEALRATRANRFRGPGSVAPEHLYPYALLHEGRARFVPPREARRRTGYLGLDNFPFANRAGLAWLEARRPKMICLNDNFGEHPRPGAVEVVRRFLARAFPHPSPWELR